MNEGEIASEIDVNRSTISRWKNNDKFREGFKGYQVEYLSNQVPKALQTMINLLDAKSELVRFQASKDILDRSGYTPIDKQELEVTTPNIINNIPLRGLTVDIKLDEIVGGGYNNFLTIKTFIV